MCWQQILWSKSLELQKKLFKVCGLVAPVRNIMDISETVTVVTLYYFTVGTIDCKFWLINAIIG